MQIGTERLEIRLLTPEHPTLWLDDLPRLEQEFTCRYRAEPLAGDFRTTVEIGYGLGRDFEHNGYMAEAVEALCTWALQQEGVRHISAETDADGFASQRLLLKCGFREHSRAETCRWIR